MPSDATRSRTRPWAHLRTGASGAGAGPGAEPAGPRVGPGPPVVNGAGQQNARRNFRSDSVSTDASTGDSVASSAAPSGKTNNMVWDPRATTGLSTKSGARPTPSTLSTRCPRPGSPCGIVALQRPRCASGQRRQPSRRPRGPAAAGDPPAVFVEPLDGPGPGRQQQVRGHPQDRPAGSRRRARPPGSASRRRPRRPRVIPRCRRPRPRPRRGPTTWRMPAASTTLPWSVPSPSGWSVSSPAGVASSRWLNDPSGRGLEQQRVPEPAPVGDASRASGGRACPSATDHQTRSPVAVAARAGPPHAAPVARVAQDATPSDGEGLLPAAGDRAQLAGHRGCHPAVHPDGALAVLQLDRPALADASQELARGVRDLDVDVLPQRRQQRRHLGPQRVEPEARRGGHEHGARDRGRRRSPSAPGYRRSALLNAVRRGLSPAPSSSSTVWTVARCSVAWVVRGIDDLDQHVGAGDLLERGAERVDQLVGQLVDEAHGVGDDRGLAVAQLHLARGRVEGREQLVLGPGDLAADERVEQRRLAGVRVADDGDGRVQAPVAAAGGGLRAAGGRPRPAPSSS